MTLLEVVKSYKPEEVAWAPNVHPLYQEPLSDLIPGERIHEMWIKKGDWLRATAVVGETIGKKLSALAIVVSQLERDLKNVLDRSAAPRIVKPDRLMRGIPPQSELWYRYTRLNAALSELDTHATRSMPAHEREARFRSAHLLRRIDDKHEKADALKKIGRYIQTSSPGS